jgi:hypothetical protein
VFDNGVNGPRIKMKKFHPRIDDEVSIKLDKFDFQTWHHYCFMFTSQVQFPYPGGYVNLTNKAYMDGELVASGTKISLHLIYSEELAFKEHAFEEIAFEELAFEELAFEELAFEELAFEELAFEELAFKELAFK